jgi:hypothetical protein
MPKHKLRTDQAPRPAPRDVPGRVADQGVCDVVDRTTTLMRPAHEDEL